MTKPLRRQLLVRRLRRVSIGAVILAFALPVAPALSHHVVIVWILGPSTPNAHSSHGMRMKMSPRVGNAGKTFVGNARGFKAGEYVTAWEFSKGGHSTQLLGGNATKKGKLRVDRSTIAGISKPGHHKICLQGERSRRVACGNYRIRKPRPTTEDTAPDGTGPGYVEPGVGPGYVEPGVGPGYVPPASG